MGLFENIQKKIWRFKRWPYICNPSGEQRSLQILDISMARERLCIYKLLL
jgi:hypothetical protein